MTPSAALRARQDAALAPGIGTRSIYAERAENAQLWDVEGKRYIDLAAGIAVNNTGHRHPRIMKAVAAQAERFTHTCCQRRSKIRPRGGAIVGHSRRRHETAGRA